MNFKTKNLFSYLISAVLVATLGLLSGKVTWKAYNHFQSPETYKKEGYKEVGTSQANQDDYASEINNGSLFGIAKTHEKSKRNVIQRIPASSLNVLVKGILAHPNTNTSAAILSVDGSTDRVFQVGEKLKPDHEIIEITSEGVVINNKGRAEIIKLPRTSITQISTNANTLELKKSKGMKALRAEIMKNPMALDQHINFSPQMQDGIFVGYKVSSGKKSDLFYKLGLKKNDTVVSLDGVEIAKLAGRMDVLTNLSIAKKLTLGILRQGKEQQIEVDFSQ